MSGASSAVPDSVRTVVKKSVHDCLSRTKPAATTASPIAALTRNARHRPVRAIQTRSSPGCSFASAPMATVLPRGTGRSIQRQAAANTSSSSGPAAPTLTANSTGQLVPARASVTRRTGVDTGISATAARTHATQPAIQAHVAASGESSGERQDQGEERRRVLVDAALARRGDGEVVHRLTPQPAAGGRVVREVVAAERVRRVGEREVEVAARDGEDDGEPREQHEPLGAGIARGRGSLRSCRHVAAVPGRRASTITDTSARTIDEERRTHRADQHQRRREHERDRAHRAVRSPQQHERRVQQAGVVEADRGLGEEHGRERDRGAAADVEPQACADREHDGRDDPHAARRAARS